MPSAIVVGGGLAGLAAAAALGDSGFSVDLFEARPFPGGRATSYQVSPDAPPIDNCQHVLLACFENLLDLYTRLGVRDRIRFHREFHFIEPGGRRSVLKAGIFPAPAHFLESFATLRFLNPRDKLGIARAITAIPRDSHRTDLDRISMLDWLREKGQTERAIRRFWLQVLVSAINEDLDQTAAAHGVQVFRTGFLSKRSAYEMGLSTVPLAQLYSARLPKVDMHLRCAVERLGPEGALAGGELHRADYYVSAVPFERVGALIPDLPFDASPFEHSPITGIHLWFDRPVMDPPHATLLDRTIQWAFNKGEGRYVQLVVSASRSLLPMPREEVIALALRELSEFFPQAGAAKLERAHVVKEARATFSARPGLEAVRPESRTAIPNLFLAGDWTRTGWPATMEGAVRSGYLAAEAILAAAGSPRAILK
ncbi:MAG TPA: hydroxysqualene dehydroxylase HpnE [Bryobacteraceae bacterium]|nr:hydroxysqualene dehydroxylase HpnE [Bryobacteraceae bacterium]